MKTEKAQHSQASDFPEIEKRNNSQTLPPDKDSVLLWIFNFLVFVSIIVLNLLISMP